MHSPRRRLAEGGQAMAGKARLLEPGVRLILAPNPSPMTHRGTNSYLIGDPSGPQVVIDPGPDDPGHMEAILAAAPGGITHILVTHAHVDHTALVPALKAATGAEVLGFGPAGAGRSARMQALAAAGLAGGGEGVDAGHAPDRRLGDGDWIEGPGWRMQALHTPGHFAGHLAFRLGDRLFSGDLAMGWASTLISPPDGDLAAFMASIERLRGLDLARLYPGHGDPVDAPAERLDWLHAHRTARSAALLAALGPEPRGIPELTRTLYADTPPALIPAAERNVFAHLIDLVDRNQAAATPDLSPDAGFTRR
ncbi:MBL fold metallo-hydrolase [Frigidibacter sp. ROC022]|uniref:MBL fold metallo-hydrolase n=1 Tax=Frigidibacter sp. ROC022 TaxID=2971796 RepID=UPI00215B6EF9|nr:MBL fold metallo-hydrolase [Frigidibacter sp. ROC022]MCR8726459.1 MBL fold metallo-hydrolase [Frigidibacter sp. ROC022]